MKSVLVFVSLLVSQTLLADASESVKRIERELGIPSGLLHAVIQVESGFQPKAVNSPVNPGVAIASYGLGQITADSGLAHCNLSKGDVLVPKKNIWCSGKILKYYLKMHLGNIDKAVAAYNWGTPCQCMGGYYRRTRHGETTVCSRKSGKPISCSAEGLFFNQGYVDSVKDEWVSKG